MYFPKTGELETYWTHHVCEDADCPGKRRNERKRAKAMKAKEAHPWKSRVESKEIQAWLGDENRDSPTYTKHSPSYWHDEKPNDGLGWDSPDTGKPESLY